MSLKKIAFLSTDNLDGYFVWDNLLIAPFAQQGIAVEIVSWHAQPVNWNEYDAVIVRSTWDYQTDADQFVNTLQQIDQSDTLLVNPLALLQWNVSKWYLQELEQQGVTIIPSVFYAGTNSATIAAQFEHFGCDELIIKPLVSANSDNTFRLNQVALQDQQEQLDTLFEKTDCMVQPFINSVVNDGEYSLFYFNGEYSHTIKKVPKLGDFRVQEEHGGQLHSITPTPSLRHTADFVLSQLPHHSLYARIDLVHNEHAPSDTQWQLMEVELIEPSLYFNMDDTSPERFVQATMAYCAAALKQ